MSVADGTFERLTSGAGDDSDPVVSPDGRTVLFANVKRTWEVIVQDLHNGQGRTVLARRTLLGFRASRMMGAALRWQAEIHAVKRTCSSWTRTVRT